MVIRWFIEEGYSREALIKEADLYTADEKLLMRDARSEDCEESQGL